jgi:hypothetical protein
VSGEATVVNLISGESQALTANLAEASYSRVKLQKTSGNDALETIWLMCGKQSISVSYKDADEITLGSGVVHINDGTNERLYHCSGFDKQLTSLGTSEWRYIYAKPPATGAVILSATEIEHATTVPTENTAKRGFYHPTNTTWRCVGMVRINSSGNIMKFYTSGHRYLYAPPAIWDQSFGSGNVNTTLDVTLTVPLGSIVACITIRGVLYSAAATIWVRNKDDSSEGYHVGYVDAATTSQPGPLDIRCDASKRITVEGTARISCDLQTRGFLIPKWIYN